MDLCLSPKLSAERQQWCLPPVQGEKWLFFHLLPYWAVDGREKDAQGMVDPKALAQTHTFHRT